MTRAKPAKAKPLEKMTVKELREIALTVTELKGVHGMNKQDLLQAVKAHRGITDAKAGGSGKRSMRQIKAKIRDLKARKREITAATNRKQAEILRRRLSRLKKKTRKLA